MFLLLAASSARAACFQAALSAPFSFASKQVSAVILPLPLHDNVSPRSHPNTRKERKEPDRAKPAFRFGKEHDDDGPHLRWPFASAFAFVKKIKNANYSGVAEAEQSSRMNRIPPEAGACGEGAACLAKCMNTDLVGRRWHVGRPVKHRILVSD